MHAEKFLCILLPLEKSTVGVQAEDRHGGVRWRFLPSNRVHFSMDRSNAYAHGASRLSPYEVFFAIPPSITPSLNQMENWGCPIDIRHMASPRGQMRKQRIFLKPHYLARKESCSVS